MYLCALFSFWLVFAVVTTFVLYLNFHKHKRKWKVKKRMVRNNPIVRQTTYLPPCLSPVELHALCLCVRVSVCLSLCLSLVCDGQFGRAAFAILPDAILPDEYGPMVNSFRTRCDK